MKRLLFALPLLALLAFAAVVVWRGLDHDPEYRAAALVGQPLPALTLTRLDGQGTAPLRRASGPYLVNVFGSWCPPCEVEHPQLLAISRAGLPMVGVNWRDQPDAARAFLQRLGDPYTVVLTDPDSRAIVELGVTAAPETLLVGADGVVIDKVSGPLDDASRERLLATARRGRR